MLKISSLARILAGQAAVICCLALPWDDPFEQYFQRKDTVTLGAGNAKEVNSATHVIDPWPRYVGNKNIAFNGERMQAGVERYRHHEVIRPISPVTSSAIQAPAPITTEAISIPATTNSAPAAAVK